VTVRAAARVILVLDHLGDALRARGKDREALAEYERALEKPHLAKRLRESIEAKVALIKGQEAR
jgi:predicted negative regulator of RcsB-dependent stress response